MPKIKQISKMPREKKKTNNVIGVVVEYKTSLGIWESFLLLRAKKMMFIEQPFERVFSLSMLHGNSAYERRVLRQLRQEPGEEVDRLCFD